MQATDTSTTPTRTRRNSKKTKGTDTVSREEQDLQTHVEICALRYEGIQTRMTKIDERFDKIENELKDLATNTNKGMSEIKTMLQSAKDEKFKVMLTATATIVVALLGMLGYVIVHLK